MNPNIIKLYDLFIIFAEYHNDLLLIRPSDPHRDEIDIHLAHMLDDIPCRYSAQGTFHQCFMMVSIDIKNDLISIGIDPEPQIILNIPLHNYSMGDVTETLFNDLLRTVTDMYNLTFEMSLSEFKTLYSNLEK